MTEKRPWTRRGFLGTAGAAAIAPTAFAHPAIGNVKGANEKLNFAIIGPGGRAQAHIDLLLKMKGEGKLVDIIGVADVWDGNKGVGRGLYPSADKAGLKHDDKLVTKDYRKILDNEGHRRSPHRDARSLARQACPIDAMEAGKGRLLRKADDPHHRRGPQKVADTPSRSTKQIFTVGVQSTADPRWMMANKMITEGKIGKVMQGQTSYYRNSAMKASGDITSSPRT